MCDQLSAFCERSLLKFVTSAENEETWKDLVTSSGRLCKNVKPSRHVLVLNWLLCAVLVHTNKHL